MHIPRCTTRRIITLSWQVLAQPVEWTASVLSSGTVLPPDGTSPGITKNGYHVVVRLGDRIYDAFTGPAGMKAVEYMAKIQARFGYTEKTLTEL
jgi:hypothetical protein